MKRNLGWKYEQEKLRAGFSRVIGCDEVGRGCLAGPVVAAAVMLPQVKSEKFKVKSLVGIKDSKLLSAKQRGMFDGIIREHAEGFGIGIVEPNIIDEINIHYASLLAMRKAVENLLSLSSRPTLSASERERRDPSTQMHSLGMTQKSVACESIELDDKILIAVDGKFIIPSFHLQQEAVVDGDAKILSIAAASIIAKVYRDGLMKELDEKHPGYGFFKHKGYATVHHRTAIRNIGLSPIHRESFCKNYSAS